MLTDLNKISNKFLFQPGAWLLALILIVSITSVLTQSFLPFAAIPVLLLIYLTILDIKVIYFLLFLLIPVSTEMDLPGGIGIDFPDELLMLGLFLVFIIWAAHRFFQWDMKPLLHPVSIILLAHYCWIAVTAFTGVDTVIGIKFLLSKSWYIVVFYLMALYLLASRDDFRTIFKVFFGALVLTYLIIIYRHGVEHDFSFAGVNFVVGPFYRNHVTYGAIGAVFLPFLIYLIHSGKKSGVWYYTYLLGAVVLLIGINLSYTRAAIGAIILALGFIAIMKYKLTKWAILASCLIAILFVSNLLRENNYLNLAPRYEKAISHTTFDDLLDATYKLEDISTMERVYRWVAGFHMVGNKPILGYGPNNFYSSYKSHTINKFRTYVSDNPERSGIHNYYLMVAVEQGIPGFLIFIALIFAVLIYAEKVFHMSTDKDDKALVLAAASSFFIVLILLLMNDLIETDKIGALFFLSMAIIVRVHIKYVKTNPDNSQNYVETSDSAIN